MSFNIEIIVLIQQYDIQFICNMYTAFTYCKNAGKYSCTCKLEGKIPGNLLFKHTVQYFGYADKVEFGLITVFLHLHNTMTIEQGQL